MPIGRGRSGGGEYDYGRYPVCAGEGGGVLPRGAGAKRGTVTGAGSGGVRKTS